MADIRDILNQISQTRWPTESLPAVPLGYLDDTTANDQWSTLAYQRTGSPAAGFAGAFIPEAATSLLGMFGSPAYAKATMKLRPTQVNIESTGPEILQKASQTLKGRALEDARYAVAKAGAKSKGLKMASSPTTKGQGVWIDPKVGAEEFNTVYSQNVGKIPTENISDYMPLQQYAESMGGDLSQFGVGAARFSPFPFNGLGMKSAANSVMYDKATPDMIKQAGALLNPDGYVVAATPNGGLLAFNPGQNNAKEIAKRLKDVAQNPRFGLVDSAYYDTYGLPQGNYMTTVDDLIRRSGY